MKSLRALAIGLLLCHVNLAESRATTCSGCVADPFVTQFAGTGPQITISLVLIENGECQQTPCKQEFGCIAVYDVTVSGVPSGWSSQQGSYTHEIGDLSPPLLRWAPTVPATNGLEQKRAEVNCGFVVTRYHRLLDSAGIEKDFAVVTVACTECAVQTTP